MLDKANHLLDTLSDDVMIAYCSGGVMPLARLITQVPGVTIKEAFHLSIAFVKQGLTSGRQIAKVQHNSTLMHAIAESAGFGDFSHHRIHEIARAIAKSGLVKQPRTRSRPRAEESAAPRQEDPVPEKRDAPESREVKENRGPENREVKENKTAARRPKLSFRDFETEPRSLDIVTKDGKICRLIN